MKRLTRLAPSAAIGLAGFLLGAWTVSPFSAAPAQVGQAANVKAAPVVQISDANAERIKLASDALTTAQAALTQEGLYVEAVKGLNPYATLSGGVDAITDLEEGRGVDPVTFAGLHVGLATDEVVPHLGKDANGRLTYKGRPVRLYPPARMKLMNERQAAVLAITEGGRATPGAQ